MDALNRNSHPYFMINERGVLEKTTLVGLCREQFKALYDSWRGVPHPDRLSFAALRRAYLHTLQRAPVDLYKMVQIGKQAGILPRYADVPTSQQALFTQIEQIDAPSSRRWIDKALFINLSGLAALALFSAAYVIPRYFTHKDPGIRDQLGELAFTKPVIELKNSSTFSKSSSYMTVTVLGVGVCILACAYFYFRRQQAAQQISLPGKSDVELSIQSLPAREPIGIETPDTNGLVDPETVPRPAPLFSPNESSLKSRVKSLPAELPARVEILWANVQVEGEECLRRTAPARPIRPTPLLPQKPKTTETQTPAASTTEAAPVTNLSKQQKEIVNKFLEWKKVSNETSVQHANSVQILNRIKNENQSKNKLKDDEFFEKYIQLYEKHQKAAAEVATKVEEFVDKISTGTFDPKQLQQVFKSKAYEDYYDTLMQLTLSSSKFNEFISKNEKMLQVLYGEIDKPFKHAMVEIVANPSIRATKLGLHFEGIVKEFQKLINDIPNLSLNMQQMLRALQAVHRAILHREELVNVAKEEQEESNNKDKIAAEITKLTNKKGLAISKKAKKKQKEKLDTLTMELEQQQKVLKNSSDKKRTAETKEKEFRNKNWVDIDRVQSLLTISNGHTDDEEKPHQHSNF